MMFIFNTKIYRIRPQSIKERISGTPTCVTRTPYTPQVILGEEPYNYDYVFDTDSSQEAVYNSCARRLVDGYVLSLSIYIYTLDIIYIYIYIYGIYLNDYLFNYQDI